MKLAAIYNTFDGEELLKGSIEQIYNLVDEIIIVYQTESNIGEPYKEVLTTLLEIYLEYDITLYSYTPDFTLIPSINELKKRVMGYDIAKDKGCTHYLFIDNDEYYLPEQFENAKKLIEKNKYDATACRLFTYFKDFKYQLTPIEDYWVPFICEIKDGRQFGQGFEVYADPTRGVKPNFNFYKFEEDEIMMHHFSYIRNDIRRKLNNSSARRNFGDIDKLVEDFENWTPDKPMINFPKYKVKEVDIWKRQ